MGRIDRLAERYERYISLPWEKDLAGAQRVIFVVYDKAHERRLRRAGHSSRLRPIVPATIGSSAI